jgi:serine/threonine-protein kinase RsbW
MTIRIENQVDATVCVVHLDGEVDLAVVPEIREALDQSIGRGCRNLVLDLEHVSYADSSALGLLVWIDHRLSPRGGKLVLVGANRDVTRVLELSGLVGMAPSISASSTVTSALEGLELAPTVMPELWSEAITLPARIETLSSIRNKVCELLSALAIPEASMFDINVAVGEALANAVRHGSPGGPSDEVGIIVRAYPDRVTIQVSDTGCGFDGTSACRGDVYASGGRGVMFMRALMDGVVFEIAPDGGTVVTLTKHLRPEAAQ